MKRLYFVSAAVVIVAAMLMPNMARAQGPIVQPSAADRGFVREVVHNNLVEIAEAKLALTRAHRSDVKGFAQELIDRIGTIDKELRQIAHGAGIESPSAISDSSQNQITALSGLSGTAFEQRYIENQLNASRNAVSLFAVESAKGAYPALQYFATKSRPTLLALLRMMEQIDAGTSNGQEPPSAPFGTGYLPPPVAH
jgi:putative membrane protein